MEKSHKKFHHLNSLQDIIRKVRKAEHLAYVGHDQHCRGCSPRSTKALSRYFSLSKSLYSFTVHVQI
jgi:hypothetical protein